MSELKKLIYNLEDILKKDDRFKKNGDNKYKKTIKKMYINSISNKPNLNNLSYLYQPQQPPIIIKQPSSCPIAEEKECPVVKEKECPIDEEKECPVVKEISLAEIIELLENINSGLDISTRKLDKVISSYD